MEDILDGKDKKILTLLIQNSKLTTQQISRKIAVPVTTVHNRIKKLEKLGVIKNYTLTIDLARIGKPISAYVFATVVYSRESHKKFSQEDIAKKIRSIEGVDGVSIVTGGTDIILRVNLGSISALNDFVTKKLRNIEGIDKTETVVIMDEF